MCDCINKFNEQLRPSNVMVEQQTVRTWVDGDGLGFLTQRVALQTSKLEPSSKRKAGVFPTFCPFCGDRYGPADTALAGQQALSGGQRPQGDGASQ